MAKKDNAYRISLADRLGSAFGQGLVNTARDSRYAGGVAALAEIAPRAPRVVLSEAGQAGLSALKLNKYRAESFPAMTARGQSLIGTPYFDNIQVVAPIEYSFVNDPMVDLEFGKNIIRTEIQGGEDVVELISQRSPAIRMRGVCWDNTGLYPEEQVQALQDVYRTDEVLEIRSYLLSLFGISQLVIEGISWPSVPGYPDTQAFEIRAFGYRPVELIVQS